MECTQEDLRNILVAMRECKEFETMETTVERRVRHVWDEGKTIVKKKKVDVFDLFGVSKKEGKYEKFLKELRSFRD